MQKYSQNIYIIQMVKMYMTEYTLTLPECINVFNFTRIIFIQIQE